MNMYVSKEVVHMKHFFLDTYSMLTCNSNMTCNMTISERFTYDQSSAFTILFMRNKDLYFIDSE